VLKTCFIITPLGSADSAERHHADHIWEKVLVPVLEPAGYKLVRSDKMTDPGQITQAIFERIRDSEVSVADLSFLNPNVMYELGVRHCLKMPVIQIKSEGTRNPFDTQNQRTIDFDIESEESLTALSAEIRAQLDWIERHPGVVSNPLTAALGRDFERPANERLEKVISGLSQRIANLEDGARAAGIEVASEIMEHGDLATMNLHDIEQALATELQADSIDWKKNDDGSVRGQFKGFDIALRPQSQNRWSSSAVHSATGYSVSYPTWRKSQEEAKKAIIQAMLDEAPNWDNG
jgi:hypothetical protein